MLESLATSSRGLHIPAFLSRRGRARVDTFEHRSPAGQSSCQRPPRIRSCAAAIKVYCLLFCKLDTLDSGVGRGSQHPRSGLAVLISGLARGFLRFFATNCHKLQEVFEAFEM